MSVASAKNFQLDEFIPKEALSTLAETPVNGNALWSIQTNHSGVHFTLFWPTEISDEDHEVLDKLTGEEKRLITQSPALLSFILKRKQLEHTAAKSDSCCDHDESKSDTASKLSVGHKRSRPCTPENLHDETVDSKHAEDRKIPKLENSASDSGLSSPNELSKKSLIKNEISIKNEQDDKDSNTTEEIKSNLDDDKSETTSHTDPNTMGVNFFNPTFPNFPQARPDLQQLLAQAGHKNSDFMQNPLISGIQGQILHAALQRRKQVEDEQKRLSQSPIHGGSINPAFRPNPQMPNLGQMMPFGHNPQSSFGHLPPGPLDACRAIINQQQRLPPPNGIPMPPTLADLGLPREGEAVFRDKYIWSESVKKYLCSVCGYSTPYRSNIIVHLPKHYPELRRFRCPICNKRYGRKDLWKSHLRSRHPEVADFVLTPSWHKLSNDAIKKSQSIVK